MNLLERKIFFHVAFLLNFITIVWTQGFPFNLGLANNQLIFVQLGFVSPFVQTPSAVQNLPIPSSVNSIDLRWNIPQVNVAYQIETVVLDQNTLQSSDL